MSWLFETNKDKLQKDFLNKINEMNSSIRKVLTSLDYAKGIKPHNVHIIRCEVLEMLNLQNQILSLVNQINPNRAVNISVSWIDGKQIPFYLWNESYQLISQQVNKDINDFEHLYGASFL